LIIIIIVAGHIFTKTHLGCDVLSDSFPHKTYSLLWSAWLCDKKVIYFWM